MVETQATQDEIELTHTNEKYTTSDVDPVALVPDGFEHDETIDFRNCVNYIFERVDGDDLVRITVKKDTFLFGVSVHANNKDEGRSRSLPAREPDDVEQVAADVFGDILDE